jgi:hypothetical protein
VCTHYDDGGGPKHEGRKIPEDEGGQEDEERKDKRTKGKTKGRTEERKVVYVYTYVAQV